MLNNHKILDENVRSINLQKRKQNIPHPSDKRLRGYECPKCLDKGLNIAANKLLHMAQRWVELKTRYSNSAQTLRPAFLVSLK